MRNHSIISRFLLLMLTIVLIATTAFMFASCGKEEVPGKLENAKTMGKGATEFWFQAVLSDGSTQNFKICTDAKTVGEALVALDLIAGDNSEWGLYVKTVCGETADYNVDGHYWAFYINGEYAMTGVDATAIEAGSVYQMKVE